MRLLVTGAAGFIGSAFTRMVAREHPGWQVLAYDKLSYAGNLKGIGPLVDSGAISFIKGDIADSAAVASVFDSFHPDAVVNFAAESHVDRSIDDSMAFMHSNVLGVSVMLDVLRRTCPSCRFLQVSTDEVYGDLPLDEGEPFTEEAPLHPSSPYSASKAAADLIALSHARTYGTDVVVSRCTNNYGPGQHPEKLIPKTVMNALSDRPVPLYGDGLNVRDWIHVDDHCRALLAILQHGLAGEVYNVSADCPLSNRDLVYRIIAALGCEPSLVQPVRDRPGHDRRYAIDSSKLRSGLKWEPQVPFDIGLADTLRWYRDNPDYWPQEAR